MNNDNIYYVTIPSDVPLLHHLTEEPITVINTDGKEEQVKIPWDVIVRNLFSAVSILVEILGDIGRYYDLRQKLLLGKSGDIVSLSSKEFEALSVVAKKAYGFKDEFKLSLVPALKSIYESPTQDPRLNK